MRRSVPFIAGLFLAFVVYWLLKDYGAEPAAAPSSRPKNRAAYVPPADGKEPGDTLVVLYGQEPDALDPLVSIVTSGLELIDNLFPRLNRGAFEKCRLTTRPGLARAWEFSPDGKTLTVRLLEGAMWDDGAPLTADDVVFSYELYADPDVASPRASSLARMLRPAVERVDESTVRFRYAEAYDTTSMLSHAGMNLVPKHRLQGADRKALKGHPFSRAPVGAGPFKFERWKSGEEVVLVRNPEAAGRRVPLLDRVVVREVPDNAARIAEMRMGRADLMDGVQLSDIPALLETGEFRILSRGKRGLEFIAWNARRPLFSDREVRRALTMAIDRDLLIRTLGTAAGTVYAQPAIGTVSPLHCDAYASEVAPLPFDPEGAAALLESRGWTDADGDGIREKGDLRFSFELLTNTENEGRKRLQVLVEPMLKRVGVEARLATLSTNAVADRIERRDFDAAIQGRSASLNLDLTPEWHSGATNRFNFASYGNPDVDRLLEQALAERDARRAAPMWKEIQRLIHEDQPFTFLYWRDLLVPVHRRFRDVRTNALSALFELEEWWVPEKEQKYRR